MFRNLFIFVYFYLSAILLLFEVFSTHWQYILFENTQFAEPRPENLHFTQNFTRFSASFIGIFLNTRKYKWFIYTFKKIFFQVKSARFFSTKLNSIDSIKTTRKREEQATKHVELILLDKARRLKVMREKFKNRAF